MLRSLGVSDSQLATRLLTVHNKVDLLESGKGLNSDGDSDSSLENAESTEEPPRYASAAAEAAEATSVTAATGVGDNLQRQGPDGKSSSGCGSTLIQAPTASHLQAPISVSAVTQQGLQQLLEEIDRKVGDLNRAGLQYWLLSDAAHPVLHQHHCMIYCHALPPAARTGSALHVYAKAASKIRHTGSSDMGDVST